MLWAPLRHNGLVGRSLWFDNQAILLSCFAKERIIAEIPNVFQYMLPGR